jgi:hypothetical protein
MAEGLIYVMGAVHGQLAKVLPLLQGAGRIDPDGLWTGGPGFLVRLPTPDNGA